MRNGICTELNDREFELLELNFKFIDFWYEHIVTKGLSFWAEQKDNIDGSYNEIKALRDKIWEVK